MLSCLRHRFLLRTSFLLLLAQSAGAGNLHDCFTEKLHDALNTETVKYHHGVQARTRDLGSNHDALKRGISLGVGPEQRTVEITRPGKPTESWPQTNRWIQTGPLRLNNLQNDLRQLYPDHLLTFSKGQRVLDTGCGGGKWVHQLREQGVEASGVDIALPIDQMKYPFLKPADLLHPPLPFKDNAFDRVYNSWVLSHKMLTSGEKIGILQELRRVTATEGRIIISPFEPNDVAAVALLNAIKSDPGFEVIGGGFQQFRRPIQEGNDVYQLTSYYLELRVLK